MIKLTNIRLKKKSLKKDQKCNAKIAKKKKTQNSTWLYFVITISSSSGGLYIPELVPKD